MVQPLTYARFPLVALVTPAGDLGAVAQLLGQVHPWDAGLRHEDNPGSGRGRTFGLVWCGRQEGFEDRPQRVGKSGLLITTGYHSITQC